MKLLICVFCIVSLVITIFAGTMFIDAVHNADQAGQIDLATRNLLIALLDAETGQRGYVITGDDGYLVPYQAGAEQAMVRVTQLQKAVTATAQVQRVDGISGLTQQKLAELSDIVTERTTHGFTPAAAMIGTHLGKNLMDSIRQQVDDIQLWASDRYNHFQLQAVMFGRMAFSTLMATILFAFIAVIRPDLG